MMRSGLLREVVVPAAHGGAIEVRAGEYLAIIDLEGAQVADFVAIQRDDPRMVLSPHQTRSSLRRWTLKVWPRREGQHPSRSARFTDPGFRVSI